MATENFISNVTSSATESYYEYEYSDYQDEDMREFAVIVISFYGIIFFLGLALNLTYISIALLKPGFLSSVNICLLNLALADVTALSVLPIKIILLKSFTWNMGWAVCKFYAILEKIGIFMKMYGLIIFMAERCISQGRIISGGCTRHTSGVFCACVWIMAAIANLPFWIYMREIRVGSRRTAAFCVLQWPEVNSMTSFGLSSNQVPAVYVFLLTFALPALVGLILIFYLIQGDLQGGHRRDLESATIIARNRRLHLLAGVMFAIRIFASLPNVGLEISFTFYKDFITKKMKLIENAFDVMAVSTSVVNPICCLLLHGAYRAVLGYLYQKGTLTPNEQMDEENNAFPMETNITNNDSRVAI